jgi:hypothetical protein
MTIQIPTPRSKLDFDNIRWYILHRNVSVFVDWEGDWMVQFDTPCEWLVDGRCSHYSLRPEVCRDYDPADCERYNRSPAERLLLRTEADLERYLAERAARAAARRAGKKKGARGGSPSSPKGAARGKGAAGGTRAARAKRA